MGNSLVVFAARWLTRRAEFAARNDAAHVEALAHRSTSPLVARGQTHRNNRRLLGSQPISRNSLTYIAQNSNSRWPTTTRIAVFTLYAILGSLMVGCTAETPPTDQPSPPSWHEQFAMPWEIDPAQVPMDDARVRDQLLRADRAARQLVGPDWPTRAGGTYPYLNWNAGSDGYNRTYQALWECDNHRIAIATTLYDQSRTAHEFRLGATHTGKEGWKVSLGYWYDSGGIPSFSLQFFHSKLLRQPPPGTPTSGLCLAPSQSMFEATRRDGRFSYRFCVRSRASGEGGAVFRPRGEDIARYWKSAASFRQAALEELNRLEERAREQVGSGQACEVWTLGGPTGAEPPRRAPFNTIPEAIKQDVLRQALDEITQQKKTVTDHYEVMHEAAVAAFPLLPEIAADSPEP